MGVALPRHMESRAKVLGHSAHQMLVPFPIGAFGLSIVFDACYAFTGRREHAKAARQALDFGLLTSAVAIPFGLVDLLAVEPHTRAKRVGIAHALGNAAMLGLFATSRLKRTCDRAPASARWLSGSAFALSGVTAWLGGELVSRHRIGVDDEAEENATSSLSKHNGRRAEERLLSSESASPTVGLRGEPEVVRVPRPVE